MGDNANVWEMFANIINPMTTTNNKYITMFSTKITVYFAYAYFRKMDYKNLPFVYLTNLQSVENKQLNEPYLHSI